MPDLYTDTMPPQPDGPWLFDDESDMSDEERAEIAKVFAMLEKPCDTTLCVGLIAQERARQVVKYQFTTAHDADLSDGTLAQFAMYMLAPDALPCGTATLRPSAFFPKGMDKRFASRARHSRFERLIVAGACIVAQMELLLRESSDCAHGSFIVDPDNEPDPAN